MKSKMNISEFEEFVKANQLTHFAYAIGKTVSGYCTDGIPFVVAFDDRTFVALKPETCGDDVVEVSHVVPDLWALKAAGVITEEESKSVYDGRKSFPRIERA